KIKGLPDTVIRTIYEDRIGNLWIGTHGDGLFKFIEEDNIFINYCKNENNSGSLNDNRVTAIFEDPENNLIVGTWGGGLQIFLRDEEQFRKIVLSDEKEGSLTFQRINSISAGMNGRIHVSTNKGLFFLEEKNKKITHYLHDPDNISSLSGSLVSLCYEDRANNIWIGTRDCGLNLFDPEENIFYNYKNEKGNSSSLSNDTIMSVYEDRAGIIWIGTFGGGINKINKRSQVVQHYYPGVNDQNCLSSSKVIAFYEDADEILWIGTRGNGVDRFDRKNKIFKNFKNDERHENPGINLITSIIEDDNENLWMGTPGGGLNKFDKKKEKFSNYRNDPDKENSLADNTIFSLAKDKSGIIWIGTVGRGLNRYDPSKEKFTRYAYNEEDPYSISSDRVRIIFIDSEELIWIGTDRGGLNKFNKTEQKFYHFKNDPDDLSSLSEDDVVSIFEDTRGILWIGTMNAGLNKFDKLTETFKRYNHWDGLPNDSINGIIGDNDGNLWISTNYGLSKFDTEKELFKNYDVRDGFQSNEFNPSASLKLKNGELAFGGLNGLNIFDPLNIKDNSFIPPVVISDFLIFNKPVAIGEKDSPLKKSILFEKELNLSFRDSVFSFEFASLDYNIPGKNQYAYTMTGFDKDWVYSGNRGFATYTNLNPGEYLFKVKGSNNDGVWNEEGSEIKINITPPFWKTWWFKTLGALVIAGTAGSLYKNKLDQILKEKKAQEDFTKRLIDVQESERKTIAEELHHSIGHDLLITKNKLLLSVKKPDDNEFLMSNINEVSEIITETLKDVREISYTLHPYQIERLGLSKAIQSMIDRVSKSTDINFVSNIDIIDKLLTPDIEINLYRIIQECINNILKHSNADEVILNIIKGKHELSVLISDNGDGFDADMVKANAGKHGFGLAGIAERTKLFRGKFLINSIPGTGTSVTVKIPLEQVSGLV
ncbi:MAG: two-component regulator propeller domain-containing protein, partial [bacterium]